MAELQHETVIRGIAML